MDRRLHNFQIFNENGGKFRVSVINLCNLDCYFCHNEAMANPRRSNAEVESHLGTDDLLNIINAYTGLGGRQVNITGGEPLAHPEFFRLMEGVDKRGTVTVLNTNAILADRLLCRPKVENLDSIFASLHTTNDELFREKLGGRNIRKVMDNIVALQRHGYDVQINFSLGEYNAGEFDSVLEFAIQHRIQLKAIALVRSNEDPDFYGGSWVDPHWLSERLQAHGAERVESKDSLGGQTTTYEVKGTMVKVKNIARGRLATDFCAGCSHREQCGEGIYGLRIGVDGLWKPCLLRLERHYRVDPSSSYESQILTAIDAMIGHWPNARLLSGSPK